ncbi:putative auxin efflux carrier component 1c [Tanacetum coccineum]
MITGFDLYHVFTAVVPLYVAMILVYGSVKWWKIFTPDPCNRFVALFVVPLLSFHFISTNNPYTMNTKFIAADTLQKLIVLVVLAIWSRMSARGSLESLSLDGKEPNLQTEAEVGDDGKLHVTVRKSTSSRNPTPRGSSYNHSDFFGMVKSGSGVSPRSSNFGNNVGGDEESGNIRVNNGSQVYPGPTSAGIFFPVAGKRKGGGDGKDLHMFVWSSSASPVICVCPIKRVAGPSKLSDMQADEKKDKQLVQATGKKGKGKQVGNQRYIKGYCVNIPKSKLVYSAVVKPQGDKNVASNMGQSLDTTKKPSPSDSSMNGMSSFINDDINLEELRNFVDKSMQEESVLEQVGNYDINGCTSREKQGEKVSSKKSSSSLEILNEDSDTDVDEVFVPKVRTTFPSSSGGGGHQLEEDAYDDYEDQFEDYPSLHQEFCDQFDFKIKGLGKYADHLSLLTDKKIVPWLDIKAIGSTAFVSFESEYFLSSADLVEIAYGDMALVVKGWAPQSKILGHKNIRGFVTHCGWSLALEAMKFLVLIISMPMHLDQPINARLVVEVGVILEVVRVKGRRTSHNVAEVV